VVDVGRGRVHGEDTTEAGAGIAPAPAKQGKSPRRHRPYTQVMRESRVAEGELSDEALLAGMAVGEQSAAVAFVRRYQRRVFGLAYSMTSDAGVAEDVAQEAMIRVWKHAPVFDPRRGSVASWVLTITRNLTIDALRLRRAVPTDPDDFVASAMRSNEHNPEDSVRRGDVRQTVRDALEVLPPEQRRAVVLASVYGRTALEISESENIPLGTAKTRIRTALIRLRAAIEHSEGVSDER
jgi:RNA polymerase sigma factor (sigma-70 family)